MRLNSGCQTRYTESMKESNRKRVVFIGAGKLGTTLAVCLSRAGYRIHGVYDIDPISLERFQTYLPEAISYPSVSEMVLMADMVFVTTSDDAIEAIACSTQWPKDVAAVHCSGVYSAAILAPAERRGVMHPLQTFARIEPAIASLPGSTFSLEGTPEVVAELQDMVLALQGRHVIIPESAKALYHASAVMASNYVVALLKLAARVWEKFGISEDQAVKCLLPLVYGTLNNVERLGLNASLTGPIIRGDTLTIEAHMAALENHQIDWKHLYQELGIASLGIALETGNLSDEKALAISRLLLSE